MERWSLTWSLITVTLHNRNSALLVKRHSLASNSRTLIWKSLFKKRVIAVVRERGVFLSCRFIFTVRAAIKGVVRFSMEACLENRESERNKLLEWELWSFWVTKTCKACLCVTPLWVVLGWAGLAHGRWINTFCCLKIFYYYHYYSV